MRLTAVLPILLSAAAISGCASSSTSPTSGSPSGSPTILSISPSQPSLTSDSQLISVQGHDFEAGATVTLTRPDFRSVPTFTGSDLRTLSSTFFQLAVVLDVPGSYQLQMTNPTGVTSAPFTFTVSSALQGSLTLISLSPVTTTASSQPQAIFVQGQNFDSTLQAILTAPDSSQAFFPGTSLTGLTTTSFSLNATMNKIGVYSLVVTNGANSISNSLTISVTR